MSDVDVRPDICAYSTLLADLKSYELPGTSLADKSLTKLGKYYKNLVTILITGARDGKLVVPMTGEVLMHAKTSVTVTVLVEPSVAKSANATPGAADLECTRPEGIASEVQLEGQVMPRLGSSATSN
jgi:hypothetical protein